MNHATPLRSYTQLIQLYSVIQRYPELYSVIQRCILYSVVYYTVQEELNGVPHIETEVPPCKPRSR